MRPFYSSMLMQTYKKKHIKVKHKIYFISWFIVKGLVGVYLIERTLYNMSMPLLSSFFEY